MDQDKILYERSTVENGEGQVFQVTNERFGLIRFLWLESDLDGEFLSSAIFPTQDAIDAAWAILRHFGEVE